MRLVLGWRLRRMVGAGDGARVVASLCDAWRIGEGGNAERLLDGVTEQFGWYAEGMALLTQRRRKQESAAALKQGSGWHRRPLASLMAACTGT